MSYRSKSFTSGDYDSVAVRLAGPEDEAAIRRVAALDDRDAPTGAVLVAEADGEVIAALAIETGRAVADPFRWTADVVALMRMRAEQLEGRAVAAIATNGSAAVKPLRTQLT